MVQLLDRNLGHFADIVEHALGKPFRDIEGAGAAGGIGGSLLAFLNADLKEELILSLTRLTLRRK